MPKDQPDKDDKPETEDERLEEGLDDTFPASDPASEAREPKPGGHEKDA
ncbi:hypothetical protein [Parvularcula lutaonensis]|uniref:Uncharacterized protein n=1 Tax=Parvularcula lutaonensis TaxID=491923 RepID=A0ABV7M8U0_9PROT|nr:hypothetical protein [Parvularcula lutaonensis]GGY44966.1 hypothetical protein GCM10007148_12400 [Parvularcula lutaonensis]